MRESAVDSHIIIAAAQNGDYLWRNNNGAFQNSETGQWIRYGLANESAKQNKIIKSSDRIGITTMLIQPHHVGRIVGVFTAIETKPSDWVFRPSDERAIAQAAYHDIVLRSGGLAGFACNIEDYKRIVGK